MVPRKQAGHMTCTRPQAERQILLATRASSTHDPKPSFTQAPSCKYERHNCFTGVLFDHLIGAAERRQCHRKAPRWMLSEPFVSGGTRCNRPTTSSWGRHSRTDVGIERCEPFIWRSLYQCRFALSDLSMVFFVKR